MDHADPRLESRAESIYHPVRGAHPSAVAETPFTQKFGHAQAGKSYKTYIENSFVAPRLMTIETFGIAPLVSPLHPIVIATPPPWLDSYFECLASKLEATGKSVVQFTAENFAALVQDTVILITTPPTPPPMVSLTYKGL